MLFWYRYSVVRQSNVKAYFEHQAAIERNFYELWKNMSLGGTGAGAITEQNLAVWDYPLGDKSVVLHALSLSVTSRTEPMHSLSVTSRTDPMLSLSVTSRTDRMHSLSVTSRTDRMHSLLETSQ